MILFKRVRDPYGWLSNMSPHPVGEYRTAEALFQACRLSSTQIQAEIRACASPMAAKMTAKRHTSKMIIQPRSVEDLALMRRVVGAKASQHPALVTQLLATDNEEIVEDVSSRQNESWLFWGAVVTPQGLRGENHLGKIWMELREDLKRAQR